MVLLLVNIWLPPLRVRGQSRLGPRPQAHVPHRREGRPPQDHRRCELQLRPHVDDADTQECLILYLIFYENLCILLFYNHYLL